MRRRDAIRGARQEASPFYTHARYIPGQTEIPIGTVHSCPTCKSDHICNAAHCGCERIIACPGCGGPQDHHAESIRLCEEFEAKEQAELERIKRERQPQFGLFTENL